MNRNTSRILVFGALAIAVNVVLGIVVAGLKIPLCFLTQWAPFSWPPFRTPWERRCHRHAFANGYPLDSQRFFVLVSIATAIVVGLMARNGKFGLKKPSSPA